MDKCENKIKNDNKIADKDKWGYVVCFGTVITFIAGIGHVNSFGLIYNDFIVETNSSAKSLTVAHGVFAVMLAIGGIILNVTIKKYSLRLGGLIGACIMITGSIATIFITSTQQLTFTFGILQGTGFGMMVPVCYATLNRYFVNKRTTVMSIIKAMQGVILMWYPQLLRNILPIYGFRGTLLIISAISLHTLPGMIVMKTNKENVAKIKAENADVENGKNNEENVDLLGVGRNGIVNKDKSSKDNSNASSFGSLILEILNLKVLKDPVYCNICIGQSFVNFSDLTFFILQPMLLFQYGYSKTDVATCISICAGADVAGRFALAIISSIVPVNTRLLFYIATLFTLLIRIVILQVRQFVWVAIVTGMLGVLRSWIHVTSPLVISNHVSHKDFPGAYALFMLTAGIVNVMFAPVIGLLKDEYQDYVPAFYALTLCCVPCLLFWPVEYTMKNK